MFDDLDRDLNAEDLSVGERRAFEALPREQDPPAALEDRTVALLRQRGQLPIPLEALRRRAGDVTIKRPTWYITVGAAAAVAVFASGLAVGQYIGMNNALKLASANAGSASEAADLVQRTGQLYVASLAALGQLQDTSDVRGREVGRQAAMAALGAAAEQMAHLAPDDPLAAAVMRGLSQRRATGSNSPSSQSQTIWY